MELVIINGQMVRNTMVIGVTTTSRAKVNIFGPMVVNMKENGRKIICMGMVSTPGLMEEDMMAIIPMIKRMGRGLIDGLMEGFT